LPFDINLDFPGVTTRASSEVIVLESERLLRTLASTVVGGGFTETRFILNHHVDKTYDHPDPVAELQALARAKNINQPFVGLLTAAHLDGVQTATVRAEGLTVAAIVTAGLSNPTSAGLSKPVMLRAGTINTILLVDASLSAAAMVNAIITATEAKTDLLRQLGVMTPEGEPATGTSTDAVVVACTGRGTRLPYAGPATPVGWLIGQSVRRTLTAALPNNRFVSVKDRRER
jgi:iron complex transport system ATP-binding protein